MLQRLRRGEIWPLPGGGTAEEVVAVARELRMDFCFFDHWPGAPAKAKALGMAAGAVVRGPWQRWMIEVGWQEAMLQMGRGTAMLRIGLERAAEQGLREIGQWAAAGVDLLLLADDVAYANGPYMSPQQLEKSLLPLYRSLREQAGAAGMTVGFHTDGCVDAILPILHQADFQFYSLEPEGTDPLRAWEVLGQPVPLFSGVPADWLIPGGFLPTREGKILRNWLTAGPLTVATACGLYHPEARNTLREIYQWLDCENFSG